MKPKLLIVELWGMGDLIIATPFLRAAAKQFDVTLLAKQYALDLQKRLWPDVKIVPFIAPWTTFKNKYHLWKWPWRKMIQLRRQLAGQQFDFGISARWDPRDHLLLKLVGAKNRIGFPRVRSRIFLTQSVERPDPAAHRYESWRAIALALKMELPPREKIFSPAVRESKIILIHTGAGQSVRVWPLKNYQTLAARLRGQHYEVQIACDADQHDWWLQAGEKNVVAPANVAELIEWIDRSGIFIGNDSGPGHLAAFCDVPTFTIFGPQLPEWFAPLHPQSEWIRGKACPYLPCSDYCRFSEPFCIRNIMEEEVWSRVEKFVTANFSKREGGERQLA